jgi:hypothetical protein
MIWHWGMWTDFEVMMGPAKVATASCFEPFLTINALAAWVSMGM